MMEGIKKKKKKCKDDDVNDVKEFLNSVLIEFLLIDLLLATYKYSKKRETIRKINNWHFSEPGYFTF